MSLLNKGVWVADESVENATLIPTATIVQADRYHLYISLACPYAHRANLVVQFLGLPITVSSVSSLKTDGWIFDQHFSDPILNRHHLYEIYQKHQHDFSGRATVPVLWDKAEQKIASNSSAELALNLATNWQNVAKNPHILVPNPLKNEIIALNHWLNDHITAKVYQIGFCRNQADYDTLLSEFFADLADLNKRLQHQPYLFGHEITLSDFFLFPTLIRFEKV
ncbi:hypothetical protein A4G20_06650 [Pasteurellaceae bacterium RH1A]|nr:hypothetical protein A4G20_06650 [Pasteurellaceae bacterium RH1A]